MKQQWQPAYPGNAMVSGLALVRTGCGHVDVTTVREGWYGSYAGDGNGSGCNGNGYGGGWGNSFCGWGDGSGDYPHADYDGVLRGPDLLDMCVTVQEFERTT